LNFVLSFSIGIRLGGMWLGIFLVGSFSWDPCGKLSLGVI